MCIRDRYRLGRLDLDGFVSERIGIEDVEAAFDKMHTGDVLRSVVVLDGPSAGAQPGAGA